MSHMERRWRPRRPLTRDQLLGIANYLTYSRIAIVPVVVVLMAMIHDTDLRQVGLNRLLSWLTMGLFTVAQLSDAVDGYYARKYGVVSSFGKFIDPLADKLLSMSVLIMLVELGRIDAWMVVLLIAREVTVTALRGIAASEGIEISASEWGKKKTFLQSFALGALLVHYSFWGIDSRFIGLVLIWGTLFVSVGSGIHYVFAFFREVLEKQRPTRKGG